MNQSTQAENTSGLKCVTSEFLRDDKKRSGIALEMSKDFE